MAQLRQDLDQFTERDVAIVVIGPENAKKFASYFSQHRLLFIGLPDPKHRILKKYGQEVNLFKFGRMPAQVLIDKQSIARFVHYGKSMSDIPSNEEILSLVDEMNQEVLELSA
jgi:peroxiredoxin Q/BCP